jgi:hypothetical protein
MFDYKPRFLSLLREVMSVSVQRIDAVGPARRRECRRIHLVSPMNMRRLANPRPEAPACRLFLSDLQATSRGEMERQRMVHMRHLLGCSRAEDTRTVAPTHQELDAITCVRLTIATNQR